MQSDCLAVICILTCDWSRTFKATYCYKHHVALCEDSYAQPVKLQTLPLGHFICTEQWPTTEAS